MSRRLLWINLALLLIVVFLAFKDYGDWAQPGSKTRETAVSKPKPQAAGSGVALLLKKEEPPPPTRYKTISEKNVFNPDRKEFPPPPPPPVAPEKVPPKKPPVRPNLTLFGLVIIGEDIRSAMINNPTRRADKGERETMTVRVGDKVGEYTVSKISDDRITVESGDDAFDVLLFDPAKAKKRPVVAPPPAEKPGLVPGQPPRPVGPPVPPARVAPPAEAARPAPVPPARDLAGRNLRERLEQRRLGGNDLPRPGAFPPPTTRRPVLPVPTPDEDEDEDE
jgi:hypothetical protein